jgi:hypothetical protein
VAEHVRVVIARETLFRVYLLNVTNNGLFPKKSALLHHSTASAIMTARLDSHCVSEHLQRMRSHPAMISVRQLIPGVSLFDHLCQGRIPANLCQLRKKHIKRHFCVGCWYNEKYL